ncbi:hypothetical protein [Lentibacillus amyloliquefaciens]|uniref:Uncharacterized protein n=1 Tax=Lentibacillus amyloliquefaciens TaxID=1472767 RepID=A0A0U3WC65_9BACI|nr:hypothetical protein [Lentibacillus amyloliquefaciens]ALX47133.1 hypothetical protein AOX59_00060 [Lentibacillus amyloliquefaciens]ALX50482.1 hypothetical protein AOX59_18985 [Lentibacillus amyloliquefaciens]
MNWKKVLITMGIIVMAFFATIVVILIVDISNDPEVAAHETIKEVDDGAMMRVYVYTEATKEDELVTLAEEIKKNYSEEVVWVFFSEMEEPHVSIGNISFKDGEMEVSMD